MRLRLKAGDRPWRRRGIRFIRQGSRPARAVVDAELAFHPQLHGVGNQAISAPVGRPRYIHGDMVGFGAARAFIGNPQSARRRGHVAFERLARFHGPALFAGPGAETALPGTRTKIGVVLGIRKQIDAPLDTHLSVAMIPMKYRAGSAVRLKLPTFAGMIVGVENDRAAPRVDVFAEQDPSRRVTASVHRRQDHRIGIRLGGIGLGLRQPLCRGNEGVRRQRVRQGFGPQCLYSAAHTTMVAGPLRLR